jgi:hypothetical protein
MSLVTVSGADRTRTDIAVPVPYGLLALHETNFKAEHLSVNFKFLIMLEKDNYYRFYTVPVLM